jgi:hypothetical protein
MTLILDKILKDIDFCKKKGHKFDKQSESGDYSSNVVYGICSRCGSYYERVLNKKELDERDYRMNSQFTI